MADVRMPDAQHVYLDALKAEVYRLHDTGQIDDDTLSWLQGDEPESVVFTGEDIERMNYDGEDAYETIMLVGTRDVDNKIRYWERRLMELATPEES